MFNKKNSNSVERNHVISLWQFSKMYTIMKIPIIDFLLTYLFIYVINALYFKYDYKVILIVTIPITIILNILLNKNIEITNILMFIIITSIYYVSVCMTSCNIYNL